MPRFPRSSWRAALLLPVVAAALVACAPRTAYAPMGMRAGALPIGDTNYPVPGGAKFVSPSGDDGADGSSGRPWRTLGHAVVTAPSGSTIVMRAGTYNEDVIVPAERRFTIQPYPNEAVWMSGTQRVTGWVADGDDWRKDGWTPRFDHSNLPAPLVDPLFPMAGHPDQAFVDGQRLQQVGSRDQVVRGTFFVDEGASRLYIGTDPANRTVEATVHAEALEVRSAGSVVRGIGFKNYGNPIHRLGAVKLSGNGVVFEHNHVSGAATAGVTVLGDDVIVRDNTIVDNGQIGLQGDGTNNAVIERNILSLNNAERFLTSSAAGGLKFTTAVNTMVRGNVAEANHGHAIWFDVHSRNVTMVRNVSRYNVKSGLYFEISENALIAGNVSTNNGTGIQVGESSNVEVWNNTMISNTISFKAYKGSRVERPNGFKIRNNVVSAPDSHLPVFDNFDVTGTMTWAEMRWDSDYNAFYRKSTARTVFFFVAANGNDREHYKSLGEVHAATTLEDHSISIDNVGRDPLTANTGSGDYRLPSGSPAEGKGAPLPDHIAYLLGLPAGVPVDMGAI